MKRVARAGTSIAAVVLALSGCDLASASFGRSCVSDDDCASTTGAASICSDRLCVTQAFLDAVSPDDPDDPDNPPDPVVPTGETCANALPIALGAPAIGTTGAALNDHGAICAGGDAPDRAYVLALRETTNLRITLEPSGFDGALYASSDDACRFDGLIAGACAENESNVGGVEELTLFGVGPGTIFIVVDGADQILLPTSGTYTLTVRQDVACTAGFVPVAGRCLGMQAEVQQVVARTNASATLLADGRVLVVGGRTGVDLVTTATAEVFDPATNSFSATDEMRVARARHAAELLQDGRVLVMGGVTGSDGAYTPTASVEVWDPATGLFSDGPPLPRRRDLFTATQLLGGRGVLVVGGRDGATTLGDVLTIDTALAAWTSHDPLAEPRFGHLALMFDNGDEVLLMGGRTGSDALALGSVESFDPRSNSLSVLADMPAPRAAAAGAVVDQGRVIVFGGYEGSASTEFLGKASSVAWDDARADWSDIFDDMVEPRLFATASAIPRLGIVVAGGSQDVPTASVELYRDDDETFLALPPLKPARLAPAAVTLSDGRVLFVGGDGGDESTTVPLRAAEILGPPPE
jgi:hypothetical protein